MKKSLFLSIFALVALMPTLTFASFESNLKYGSKGDSVKELQEFLADEGVYIGPITGNFFALTRKAVVAFQTKYSISPASGYFGPLTRVQANTILEADLATSNGAETSETGSVTAPVQTVSPEVQAILDKFAALNTKVETQTQTIANQNTQIAQQSQTINSTLNQIAQNTNKVVENTTPVIAPVLTISDVVITPKAHGVKIKWKTSLAIQSEIKIYPTLYIQCPVCVTGQVYSFKSAESLINNSTSHSINYETVLNPETDYSFIIKADNKEYVGTFKTLVEDKPTLIIGKNSEYGEQVLSKNGTNLKIASYAFENKSVNENTIKISSLNLLSKENNPGFYFSNIRFVPVIGGMDSTLTQGQHDYDSYFTVPLGEKVILNVYGDAKPENIGNSLVIFTSYLEFTPQIIGVSNQSIIQKMSDSYAGFPVGQTIKFNL